ncbi:hypothetical protein HGM15179_020015 [Zosterops borbonicus]|uniref:Uncharacterized protein n=1 Tax=Zosterops borbonicus TaxID=364589 RepID=A0A8K1D9Z2_9PASS|nr:hypothetical protein HGM15179_020015 [Zosterops borbonicus]
MSNSSSSTQFLLLAFADPPELQPLHLWLFLGISLAALLGNGLISPAIVCNHHLHTARDFSLLNLLLLHQGSVCTTDPKATVNSLQAIRVISCGECATQVIFLSVAISSCFRDGYYESDHNRHNSADLACSTSPEVNGRACVDTSASIMQSRKQTHHWSRSWAGLRPRPRSV